MKNLYFVCIALLLLTTFINVINAQESTDEEDPANKLSLTEGNVNNQFEFIIQRSNNYQEYKVVKKNWLYTLKKNTLDSLARVEKELAEAINLTKTQKSEIESLQGELKENQDHVASLTNERDSISFFGALIDKSAYKATMWGIVALLTAVLLFFIYKFRNSNVITQDARKALEDLENEYEDHRKKALEREQKVRRQLQDEINKQKIAKAK
ncbi:tRNA (guanine-N1)-methyltransferase [Sinomicrobium weinanense]|uniref:tRNA (Guanine-N1)-methyltransferase n=1 Tax=Sinomicrobium weinanense TaxID=2842200 RepID=A0A926JWC1_9FLAO|nr:tRNA (guanine-N1)-methyltransferase [Sinomicrobium weinanense]MBC9798378.1 tRNA (guanine-N1)-methyltransferase [Sinomicrobium weinanense]MBU3122146.1 tRNA (guanine-N1)-methyltransferase [Sinomicrobium weinanense]